MLATINIIITVITVVVMCSKHKKRIIEFKEKIMSVSFVKGITDTEITKKEDEEEEVFI